MSTSTSTDTSTGAPTDTRFSRDLPENYEQRVHRAVVTQVRWLGPGMVRVTLAGPDMHDYATTGVGDEYVRLFFPDTPDEAVRLPYLDGRGWKYDGDTEPSLMRTYTVRDHRPGEIDVDFVVHEGGVAGAWAVQAKPGQELGIVPPNLLYVRPDTARRQILVTDEPGLPAALRIAELTGREVTTTVVAEVRGAEHQLEADPDLSGEVEYLWLRGTGNGIAPSGLTSTVRSMDIDGATYVWVATEARESRELRKFLRHEKKLAAENYKILGYWTDNSEQWTARWEALGEEFREKIDAIYSDESMDTEDMIDEVNRLYEEAGL